MRCVVCFSECVCDAISWRKFSVFLFLVAWFEWSFGGCVNACVPIYLWIYITICYWFISNIYIMCIISMTYIYLCIYMAVWYGTITTCGQRDQQTAMWIINGRLVFVPSMVEWCYCCFGCGCVTSLVQHVRMMLAANLFDLAILFTKIWNRIPVQHRIEAHVRSQERHVTAKKRRNIELIVRRYLWILVEEANYEVLSCFLFSL